MIAVLPLAVDLYEQHRERAGSEARAEGQTEQPQRHVILIEAPAPDPQPERDEWREEQDLQAQRDMARWALAMVIVSAIATAFTAAGVWYIRDTLKATLALNRLTRELGEAQVRAYPAIEEASLEFGLLGHVAIDFVAFNAGQSPALSVLASVSSQLQGDTSGLASSTQYKGAYLPEISAGTREDERVAFYDLVDTPADWGDNFDKLLSVHVEIVLYSKDVFGHEYLTMTIFDFNFDWTEPRLGVWKVPRRTTSIKTQWEAPLMEHHRDVLLELGARYKG